jgi:hypothetical protein
MLRDWIVPHHGGAKHSPEQIAFAEAMFSKLNAYLVDLHTNNFHQLGDWLEFMLMQQQDGRVIREDGTLVDKI